MKRSFQSTFLCVVALLGALLVPMTLTGCNTVEGFGKDLEETGENISEASKDVRE